MSDLRHTVVQTLVQRLDSADFMSVLLNTCSTLESEIYKIYQKEGVTAKVQIERTGDLRYCGQEHTITVPLCEGAISSKIIAAWSERFAEYHQREYGFTLPDAVEIVNLRLSGVVSVPKPSPQLHKPQRQNLREAQSAERWIHWIGDRRRQTPIYSRALLPGAAEVDGPAVIEEMSTTTIIPDGFRSALDEWGNIILRRR